MLSIPLDRAMLCGEDEPVTSIEREHFADSAVRVFIGAYARKQG